MRDILDKINAMLETRAEDVAKARKPMTGMLRPREVGKKDRVKKERKKERRDIKSKLRQYY